MWKSATTSETNSPDMNSHLPFIDLHRHLDGNIRLQTMLDLARQHQLKLPGDTL